MSKENKPSIDYFGLGFTSLYIAIFISAYLVPEFTREYFHLEGITTNDPIASKYGDFETSIVVIAGLITLSKAYMPSYMLKYLHILFGVIAVYGLVFIGWGFGSAFIVFGITCRQYRDEKVSLTKKSN